jgi:hypothetical protein
MKHAKSADGLIHLISAVNVEFTMCGNAYEGIWADAFVPDSSNDPCAWEQCPPAPITCPNCAAQIRQCRGVRISAAADSAAEVNE